jgi:hypothetical protein
MTITKLTFAPFQCLHRTSVSSRAVMLFVLSRCVESQTCGPGRVDATDITQILTQHVLQKALGTHFELPLHVVSRPSLAILAQVFHCKMAHEPSEGSPGEIPMTCRKYYSHTAIQRYNAAFLVDFTLSTALTEVPARGPRWIVPSARQDTQDFLAVTTPSFHLLLQDLLSTTPSLTNFPPSAEGGKYETAFVSSLPVLHCSVVSSPFNPCSHAASG